MANSVVLSGVIFKKFKAGTTKTGKTIQSGLLTVNENREYNPRFWITAFGDAAEVFTRHNEGETIIVQGKLSETSFKDKDDQWQKRIEVVAFQIESPEGSSQVEDNDVPF